MSNNNGWIGVDLDGTLAYYDKWVGVEHIGEPIPLMLQRVKNWLKTGQKIKIFTARISQEKEEALKYINAWCLKHIGQEVEVTNVKDMSMSFLFDDRAVQIEKNTGKRIDKADDCEYCDNTGLVSTTIGIITYYDMCSCIYGDLEGKEWLWYPIYK